MASSPTNSAPVIIIMGPTGAGKTTLAQTIAARKGWYFISSGDLLRASDDEALKRSLELGETAPSEVIQELIYKEISSVPADQTIVADGFPRKYNEYEDLMTFLTAQGRVVQRVIQLEASEDTSRQRLQKRGRGGDDLSAAFKKKREWYRKDTARVLERFAEQGLLAEIDGDADEETVYNQVMEAL